MKRFLQLVLLLFVAVPAFPQSADERVGELINRSDWFGLEKAYPVLKDSMQADYLKLMAEIMIGCHFNRPDEAIAGIGKLLREHQGEIGAANALSMAVLACQMEGLEGNYAVAAQSAEGIAGQIKAQGGGESYAALEETSDFYRRLSRIPAPSVERPQGDVSVPVSIEKVELPAEIEPKGWRGTHILMPVEIQGRTYRFIFDTGAGTSFMSERLAQEVGVRILNDSLAINRNLPGAMYGKLGTLDSLKVGGMTFRYPLIAVAPPNALDSVMAVDAVLGMDFIGLFDEFRIYPQENRIVFPVSATPLPATGRNLMLSDRALKLCAASGSEMLTLHFDTGCTTAGLYYRYYEKHKHELDAVGKREKRTEGGFNVVQTKEILCLPSFRLEVGGEPVELHDLAVDISDDDLQMMGDDGIMGMDMVNRFDCVTVNLKDMFLKVE